MRTQHRPRARSAGSASRFSTDGAFDLDGGDTLSFLFQRLSADAKDTCNDELLVPAIEVEYKAR